MKHELPAAKIRSVDRMLRQEARRIWSEPPPELPQRTMRALRERSLRRDVSSGSMSMGFPWRSAAALAASLAMIVGAAHLRLAGPEQVASPVTAAEPPVDVDPQAVRPTPTVRSLAASAKSRPRRYGLPLMAEARRMILDAEDAVSVLRASMPRRPRFGRRDDSGRGSIH